jgi:hypothetical protein
MKAFIVAALLVAAVAGQSTMDILKLNKEKALLNKFDSPIMSELLLKKLGYPTEKTMFGDKVDVDMPLYLQDELMDKKVLNIEELMSHPLFREYINLPLFHQYIEYPAFQKFVTSVYFQKFWQIPAFKQYFLNPVFFYKYIYPIVNLFKTDITIPTSVYGDDLIKGSDMIVNKNVFPFVTGFEGDLLKEKLFVPTMYNEELKLKNNFHLKSLLVKIYSHLFNIPEELIKEHFLTEKFNYPVDTFKTFDSIYGDKLNKDVLLKKLLLNKMIVGDKTFDSIYGDKLNKDVLLKKLLLNKMMLGEKINYPFDSMKTMDSTIFEDKLTKDVLLKKLLLNKMILGDKTFKTVLPEEYILREKMMKMNPLVSRMMYGDNKLPIFNKFETIDNLEKMNMFDINMKKDLIKDEFLPIALKKELLLKDKILYNKIFNDKVQEINTFGTYETLPKVVDFTTPMMGVRTFDKKFFPETIIKA